MRSRCWVASPPWPGASPSPEPSADRGNPGERRVLPVEKLAAIERRKNELEHLLCSPAVLSSPGQMQKLNKELSQVTPVVEGWVRLRDVEKRIAEDREILGAGD